MNSTKSATLFQLSHFKSIPETLGLKKLSQVTIVLGQMTLSQMALGQVTLYLLIISLVKGLKVGGRK